ncbi:Leucine amino peptidase [Paragonimus heterotremus]|uniref:Leucine amino peptidase n=1 Tax=Paragonimus heterotremus TaxID=100268 RepID=A0A8J4ST70_9TREM|nr:Leucine amino peptidase [Paragonimus heterotremus]
MEHLPTTAVTLSSDLSTTECDSLVLVLEDVNVLSENFSPISSTLNCWNKSFSKLNSGVHVIYCEQLPSHTLVVSFTGALDRDFDDIRRITDASKDGIAQAVKAGSTKPMLALAPLKTASKLRCSWADPKSLCLAALLSALHELYVPLEVREFSTLPRTAELTKSIKASKVESLYWFSGSHYAVDHSKLIHVAWCLEEGRRVARDIGGSDPERMRASHIVDYLKEEFADSGVTFRSGPVDAKLYPLAAVVDRGSNDSHRGSIVHLEYRGSVDKNVKDTDVTDLFLIGKGIIYDTGGSDLKVGGIMATMHRDKCGAAAVAGFFKSTSLLKPKNLNLHGSLALVRNSIGSSAYVSDEIITSRAGIRVRVNNTDAEGRMVMTDLLCEAKEQASRLPKAFLMTFATLTGHVVLSYGPNYTGLVCNGPARHLKMDHIFQQSGELLGEMSEISTLRREDYEAHKAHEPYADLLNSARPVGGKRVRGHQSPAAFMIVASGLDSHMCNSEKPHFDIAGSQGTCPGIPTAAPLLTLASQYLLGDYLQELLKVRL